jgi:small subunit ribosomal protein S18
MAVVKKVQSRVVLPKKEETKEKEEVKKTSEVAVASNTDRVDRKEEAGKKGTRPKRVCAFCEGKNEPHYWDAAALRRYVSDRGRIMPRARVGCCAKHQRRVSQEIKRARHLAMIPFKVRI